MDSSFFYPYLKCYLVICSVCAGKQDVLPMKVIKDSKRWEFWGMSVKFIPSILKNVSKYEIKYSIWIDRFNYDQVCTEEIIELFWEEIQM